MRQVLRAGALGRPRGMGWGGRQEGGSGCGTHVNPWLIHVNVWQKPLQYCKVISLQLIKINEKKSLNSGNFSFFPFVYSYFKIRRCSEHIPLSHKNSACHSKTLEVSKATASLFTFLCKIFLSPTPS